MMLNKMQIWSQLNI